MVLVGLFRNTGAIEDPGCQQLNSVLPLMENTVAQSSRGVKILLQQRSKKQYSRNSTSQKIQQGTP
ncbi:MAG: hypothetical protein IPM61_12790 [Chlorobi bacterium]|nr:hypothetical protein [Chlorobiota bacterium]MBX7215911.1 hypothetical protein [Candidatus Kapabacteria bacterium]